MENWYQKLDEAVQKIANDHTFQEDETMVVFANNPTEGEKGICKSVIYGNGLSVCATIAAIAHKDPILCEIIEVVFIELIKSGKIIPDQKKYLEILQK